MWTGIRTSIREAEKLREQIEPLGGDAVPSRRLAASGRVVSSDFANIAPANVVQKERDRLADFHIKAEKLREQIERLG